MPDVLTSLLTGLLIAAVPALLTIGWQMHAHRREANRLRRERLSQAFLNFRSETEFIISLTGVADAHLGAVSHPKNFPAMWFGYLPPFDLARFGDNLIEHTIRHFRATNELLAVVDLDKTRQLVRDAVSATEALVEIYMPAARPRSKVWKLRTSRPESDKAVVRHKREELNRAFATLEIALNPPRRWKLGRRWP